MINIISMNDEDIADAINGLWIFVAGVLCFLMQAGEIGREVSVS